MDHRLGGLLLRQQPNPPQPHPCRNIACCQLRVALGPKQTVLQKRCAPSASFTPPKLARQRACGRETVYKRGCVLRSGLRRSPVASWGPRGPQQFSASHSRQLLVKDERLVRYGVSAVMCAAGPRAGPGCFARASHIASCISCAPRPLLF